MRWCEWSLMVTDSRSLNYIPRYIFFFLLRVQQRHVPAIALRATVLRSMPLCFCCILVALQRILVCVCVFLSQKESKIQRPYAARVNYLLFLIYASRNSNIRVMRWQQRVFLFVSPLFWQRSSGREEKQIYFTWACANIAKHICKVATNSEVSVYRHTVHCTAVNTKWVLYFKFRMFFFKIFNLAVIFITILCSYKI